MSSPPTILLLQARVPDDPVRDEERASFAEKSRLPIDHIVTHDLLEGPPTIREIRHHDALMVGGAGDFYVSKGDLPEFPRLLDSLREVVAIGHPTFASCFGFQCLIVALGGQIVYDPDSMEVGTYEVTLTAEGADDELLGALPERFLAQMGRKDRAESLPPAAVHLARSARCDYHSFRIPNKPIWTTQFHPEMNREENLRRYHRYLDGYAPVMSEDELEKTFERFVESPEAIRLIPRFMELVLGWKG